LQVKNLGKQISGNYLFKNISFTVERGDKIAIVSKDPLAVTAFYEIIAGADSDFNGEYKWGVTITPNYLPNDNSSYFTSTINLIDWLRQYSKEKDETFIRGFLGRMLFSCDETLKICNVLSGVEKVRCMISRMMLLGGNALLLDEPTNHLDLESISAFNDALKDFSGIVIFTSHDHQFVQTIANRVIEISANGMIDRLMTYDEYIADEQVKTARLALYPATEPELI
jgi:ATPase subunit of ABC transporter with duplicated ATPase domains